MGHTVNKRALALLLAATLAFGGNSPTKAYAQEAPGMEAQEIEWEGALRSAAEGRAVEDNFTWKELEDGTVEITKYKGSGGHVSIPGMINGKKVGSIGSRAFYYCTSLTSIEIPEGVTSIGSRAFYYCTSLTSIEIPAGVTSIGDDAFSHCSSLISIEIPAGVTNIGNGTFSGCSSLASIEIPKEVASIGSLAFSHCSSLTSIDVAEGNCSYASQEGILYNKEKTKVISCPGGITGSIQLAESVTNIGNHAFYYCTSLTSIEIPAGVTNIGEYAFFDCSSLTSIEIPAGVTNIGNIAFSGCSSLTSIEIPTGVTNIGIHTFSGCSSLTSIEIPTGVTNIGNGTFSGCSSLTSIEIPAGVTNIGEYAFSRCSNLTSIEIPAGVTSIGDGTFSDCSSLTSIEIPAGVTSIGDGTFSDCSSLTSIEIPAGVTSIGDGAFSHCSSLTSIKISEGVLKIGAKAFANTDIRELTVPGTVADIVYDAFFECMALETVVMKEGIDEFNTGAFRGCTNIKEVTIPKSVSTIKLVDYELADIQKNWTILCYLDSAAHKYAVENGIPFRILGNHTHRPAVDPAVEPTCTEGGRTEGSHCSLCGEILKEPQAIPKKGHTMRTQTKKAAMGKDGSTASRCSVCGVSSTSTIYAPKTVTLSKASFAYNGKTQKPSVTVKDRTGKTLKEKTDYSVSYSKGRKNIGKYTVTVRFQGNYEGSTAKSFQITARKGTVFSSGTCKYKMQNASDVAAVGLKNKKATKITIPKTVAYGGKSFRVVSIADKAFRKSKIKEAVIGDNVKAIGASAFEGCGSLGKASLGKNAEKIGKNAFKGCKKLNSVTINSSRLKSAGAGAFQGISGKASLKVPKKKLSAYKKILKGKGQGKKVKIVKL